MKNGYSMVRPFVLTALWLLASLLTSSAIYAQNCVVPPLGLVSWWPGDGNANDIVGINPGALQNGATFVTGQVEQAFRFDGMDDFVKVPPITLSSFTVEFWVNPNAAPNAPNATDRSLPPIPIWLRNASHVGLEPPTGLL